MYNIKKTKMLPIIIVCIPNIKMKYGPDRIPSIDGYISPNSACNAAINLRLQAIFTCFNIVALLRPGCLVKCQIRKLIRSNPKECSKSISEQQKWLIFIKPAPGLGVERTATSPSLNFHLHSCIGRTITSYHPRLHKSKFLMR